MLAQRPAELATVLKTRRAERQITQQQLSEKLGVSVAYVSMLENGEKVPSPDLVPKLAESLAYPADQLLLMMGRLPADVDAVFAENLPEVATLLREKATLMQMRLLFDDDG